MTMTVAENTLLTAYNKDIQRFILMGGKSTTHKKTAILESIEENVINKGESFERLFPPKTKRLAILDYIVFMASGSGICKIESKTLANKTDSSVRTVGYAIENIKETGQFVVAGLADGKNKYVFVLKSHSNFKSIMKEVFFMDNAELNAGQIAEQGNAETFGAVRAEGQKTSSNYTNLINSKQERDIIQRSIEDEIISIESTIDKDAEYISNYYVSEFQKLVYDYIHNENNGFHESIKASAVIIGLRVGSNCDHKQSVKAGQTLIKIDGFIKRGGVVREGVPALFTRVFQHGLDMWEYERQYKLQNPSEEAVRRIKPVPFYNWLVERE